MADHRTEEEPPEIERAIEDIEAENFNGEATIGEPFCGLLDGGMRFRGHSTKSAAFQNSDAQATQIGFVALAQGNGSGERVAGIRPGHDFEQRTDISDGAGHWADDANPGECAGARWKMSGGRNAAGRGLQSTDATKMGGHANGAAAIAADAASGTACGDGCGFSTAGAARGMRQVPGIAGFSSEEIVRLIGHQKFGRVRVPEEDSTGGFQTRDKRSVGARDVVLAKKRAGGARPGGDVNATFDGERNAMERAELSTSRCRRFRCARLLAGAFAIQMHESIQIWLACFNAFKMRFDDLYRRDFFRANFSGNFLDRVERRHVQGLVRERMRPRDAGQGCDEMREGPD